MSECDICMLLTNKTTRKLIVCPYCNCNMCKPCLQKTILDDVSPEPKCPGCKAVYNRHILLTLFPVSFITKDYKVHREKVLLDGEKARLPEAIEDSNKYLKSKKFIEERDKQTKEAMEALKKNPSHIKYCEINKEYIEFITKNYHYWKTEETRVEYLKLRNELSEHEKKYKLSKEYIEFRGKNKWNADYNSHVQIVRTYGKYVPRHEIYDRYNEHGLPIEPAKKEREKHFIKACPMKDCRGFLSAAYKCGLCESHICKDCNEYKKSHKDEEHICDAEKVASVKLIASETTPCPKCAIPIYKINGCDQMFCTNCHTAFSFKTGNIETGVVHNPHYFEWMRKNNMEIPTNTNAVIRDACGNLNWAIQDRLLYIERIAKIERSEDHKLLTYYTALISRYRIINDAATHVHTLQYSINRLNGDERKHKLRVKYLIKEIDEKSWKFALQKDEKGIAREQAKLHLLEMFVAAGRLIFQKVIDPSKQLQYPFMDQPKIDPVALIEELNNLIKFVNEQSQFILKDYQNTTPGYDYNWVDEFWKFIPCKKTYKKKSKTDSVITHVETTGPVYAPTELTDSEYSSDNESSSSDEDDGTAYGGAGITPPPKKT